MFLFYESFGLNPLAPSSTGIFFYTQKVLSYSSDFAWNRFMKNSKINLLGNFYEVITWFTVYFLNRTQFSLYGNIGYNMYLRMHKYIIKEKYCQLDGGRHERGLGTIAWRCRRENGEEQWHNYIPLKTPFTDVFLWLNVSVCRGVCSCAHSGQRTVLGVLLCICPS